MNESIETESPGDYSRTSSTDYITAHWCMLPPHVREAIVTLVDAGVATSPVIQPPRATVEEGKHEEH